MLTDQVIATRFAQGSVLSGIGLLCQQHLMDDDKKSMGESETVTETV
jgi:hypothetical protein